jgi:hypothetical protein
LARSQNTQQVTRVTELEEANTSLQAEHEAACTILAKVDHRERTLTSKNEGLKRDLEGALFPHKAAMKEKELVQQAEQVQLQQFKDTIHKRLAELRRDTEASIATLGG